MIKKAKDREGTLLYNLQVGTRVCAEVLEIAPQGRSVHAHLNYLSFLIIPALS